MFNHPQNCTRAVNRFVVGIKWGNGSNQPNMATGNVQWKRWGNNPLKELLRCLFGGGGVEIFRSELLQWFSTGGSRPKKESRTPSGCVDWSKKPKEKIFNAHLMLDMSFILRKKNLFWKACIRHVQQPWCSHGNCHWIDTLSLCL